MKILAIDLGDKRTGISLSDPTGLIPGESFTLEISSWSDIIFSLIGIASKENVDLFVVGHPLNMDGTVGERGKLCEAFAERLKDESGIGTVLWDERRTTVTASHILSDAGKKKEKQRKRVDAVAASVILQSYLDHIRLSNE